MGGEGLAAAASAGTDDAEACNSEEEEDGSNCDADFGAEGEAACWTGIG